jgi:hypothetical protein
MSLASLIAEVEKLTGPNYEIERRVTEVTGYPNVYRQPDGTIPHNATFPAFTASLDAVVALIEREGLEWLRKSPDAMTVYAPLTDEQEARKEWAVHFSAAGATPAIALLAAALRALEARAG